jgi:prepilin-type processing-associated H-X9-DG protein
MAGVGWRTLGSVAVLVPLLAAGCKKSSMTEDTKPVAVQPGGAGAPARGGVARTIDRARIENALKQIGLAYHTQATVGGRGPATQKELMEGVEQNAKIKALLDGGHLEVIYGVNITNLPGGSSNTVLAYEKEPDESGSRYVLFADGSVRLMDKAAFDAAPKARKN